MSAEDRPGRGLVLVVAGLAAWGLAEWLMRLGSGLAPPRAEWLVAVWAVAMPLPLLLVRRWPTLAGVAVIALILSCNAAGYRVPGSGVSSVVTLVVLFLAEASRARAAVPVRGIAIGVLLVGGTAALDLLDIGHYAKPQPANYAVLLMLAAGGVGAGVALRDRRAEVARLEAELRAAGDRAAARLRLAVAAERTRIAAEIDGAVALLLHRVRPLAERAAAGGPTERVVADMQTVEHAAMDAMTEMRRALRLLRAPGEDRRPPAPDAAEPRLDRHARARRLLGAAAPVALLAAVGLYDQTQVDRIGAVLPGLVVPAPVLGPVSPYVMAVVGVLPLLARRRAPLAATLAVCALLLVRMATHDLSTLTWSQYYVAAAAAFLGAAHGRTIAAAVAAGVAAVGASVGCLVMEEWSYDPIDYVFVALLPAASAVAGLVVRDGVATAARAHEAREEVDRLHEERARERLAAERLEAARDLHDVIGHAVTVVGMQAAVARRYAELDEERARAAAAIVAEVAADAERDLRRLTEFLDAEPPTDVAALVERWRGAGMPVTLDDRLDRDAPPRLALVQVAFRLVQEALTNAGRHAGDVPTTVTLAADGDVLVVEVVNALGPGGVVERRGGGIAGMRERAESYGGTLTAGPDGAGAWRVLARLPSAAGDGAIAARREGVVAGGGQRATRQGDGAPHAGYRHRVTRQIDAAERTVRALFDAFAARDVERSLLLVHPELEHWAEATAELTRRTEPYHGREGLVEYLADVDRVWASLTAEPRDIRVAGTGVVVFGSATGAPREGGERRVLPLSWVIRMRDGLIEYVRVARAPAAAPQRRSENAASKATSEGGKSVRRTNASASGAP